MKKKSLQAAIPTPSLLRIQFYVLTEFSCSNEGILLLLSCSKRQRATVFKQIQLSLGLRKFLTLQEFSHWIWLSIRLLNLKVWNEIQTPYRHTILWNLPIMWLFYLIKSEYCHESSIMVFWHMLVLWYMFFTFLLCYI